MHHVVDEFCQFHVPDSAALRVSHCLELQVGHKLHSIHPVCPAARAVYAMILSSAPNTTQLCMYYNYNELVVWLLLSLQCKSRALSERDDTVLLFAYVNYPNNYLMYKARTAGLQDEKF